MGPLTLAAGRRWSDTVSALLRPKGAAFSLPTCPSARAELTVGGRSYLGTHDHRAPGGPDL